MLTIVILCSCLLRILWIPAGEFRYDDIALGLLSQLQASGEFQFFGMQSSNGGLNFPASVYFLAGLFTLTSDYYGVLVLIVVFNGLGIWFTWLLTRRLYDVRVATITAILMSVSVWATQFSRRMWAQEFNSPFLIAGVLLAIWGYIDGRKWAQLWALPLLLFGMQIHFAAFALMPAFLFIVWKGRRNADWRPILGSLLISTIYTAPFIFGVSAGTTDAPNILARFADQVTVTSRTTLEPEQNTPLQALLDTVGGTGLDRYYSFPSELVPTAPLLPFAAMILWAGALIGLIQGVRQKPWVAVLLLTWILVPLLVMATGVVGSHMFYFIMLLPPLMMLCASGFVAIAQRLPRVVSPGLVAVVLFGVGSMQIVYIHQFFEQVIRRPGFAYSTPVGFLLDARGRLPPTEDLIMIGTRYLNSEGDIWSLLMYHRTKCVRELAMDEGVDLVILPSHPFIVMYGVESELNPLYVNDAPTEIPLRSGDEPYIYYQFEEAPHPPTLDSLIAIPEMTFADALSLQGYSLLQGRVTLDYRLRINATRDNLKFFAHFLDNSGERIGQLDASFYPGKHWCDGDRYLISFEIPPTAEGARGIATLRLGMYRQRGDSITGVDAFDANGMQYPWVDIRLSDS